MNLLSAKLQATIKSRPTDTILRSESTSVDTKYTNLLTQYNVGKKDVYVPDVFDGRDVWKGLLTVPRNQGTCGACWAFSATSCLSDRFNIQSMGLLKVDLSAAKLILCDHQGEEYSVRHPEYNRELVANQETGTTSRSSCFGSSLMDAWRYLYVIGTNTSKCFPYDKSQGIFTELSELKSFTTPQKMPICMQMSGILGDMCSDFTFNEYTSTELGTPARFYKTLHIYAVAGTKRDGGDEKNIRHNIFEWGPVSSAMKIYPDFYTFGGDGIYEWNKVGSQLGGHAVEIVGWGDDKSGKLYWIVKNSWGLDWGDGGYFKMIRGTNDCEIEENIVTGIPDYFYPLTYDTPVKFIWSESDKAIEQRRIVATELNQTAGGIDPETGYSRRVKAVMAWTVFRHPIKLDDLPDYSKWVAGVDCNIENRLKYQRMINDKNNEVLYTNDSLYVIVIVLIIILSLIIIFTFVR